MLQADYCVYFLYNFIVQGGKNFHIFHYLLYGMPPDQLQEYSLTSDYPHRSVNHNLLNLVIFSDQNSRPQYGNRPWGITMITTEFVGFITQNLMLRSRYCVTLNFNISKLV